MPLEKEVGNARGQPASEKNSIAIGKSLEMGEGYAPNIFSASNNIISNPHQLTIEEIMEVADYSMQLWMELKNNLWKYGMDDSKIFNVEK